MRENIYETQAKQMEWTALDDIDRCAVVRMKNNTSKAKAETLLAMSTYMRQTVDTAHTTRLRGVAQGMIQTCYILGVFSKEEYECLLKMLKK